MKLNYKIIAHILGLMLLFNGVAMIFAAVSSGIYKDGATQGISLASFLTLGLGGLMMFVTQNHSKEIGKKEGYLVVSLAWLIMAVSGSFPYLFTGAIPNFTDAFFETLSGYTTTGASVINDIESLPKGILLWRSLTHWMGGMGIIVLAIAILPLLGIGGVQLFSAESPGISTDKINPRISDTAKRLWLLYVGFTVVETILLKLAGMTFFDAINHAMSTLSTGGFSTKNASVAFWNDQPFVQYIIVFFMILAGTNFALSFLACTGRVQKLLFDQEFKWYLITIGFFTVITTILILTQVDMSVSSLTHPQVWGSEESAFRHALFQVVAIITTTGFVTADYTLWTPFLTILFFAMMFLGGSTGSTAGGIKILRHLILFKNGFLEFKRSLHPNAIIQVRFNQKTIARTLVFNVLAFYVLYMLLFVIGAAVLAMMGLNFETALGGAASSLGNVGPALGNLGPATNYASLPLAGKWWCTLLMLVGRLELFTVLMLFSPYFWRRH